MLQRAKPQRGSQLVSGTVRIWAQIHWTPKLAIPLLQLWSLTIIANTESALCARHYAKGFTSFISLNPPDNSLRLDNYLHFTDGEPEAQRWKDLPKVTQLENTEARLQTLDSSVSTTMDRHAHVLNQILS